MEILVASMFGVVGLFILWADDTKQVKKRTRRHLQERRIHENNLKRKLTD